MLEKLRFRSEKAISARRSALGVTLPARVDDVLLDYIDHHAQPLATSQLLNITLTLEKPSGASMRFLVRSSTLVGGKYVCHPS